MATLRSLSRRASSTRVESGGFGHPRDHLTIQVGLQVLARMFLGQVRDPITVQVEEEELTSARRPAVGHRDLLLGAELLDPAKPLIAQVGTEGLQDPKVTLARLLG